jgi:type II secretory pathway pseudopilin PulG
VAVTSVGRCERGFTLLELVVASTLTLVTTGLAVMLLVPLLDAFRREAETQDVRQRMRATSEWLTRALIEAGAGPYASARDGPLNRFIPAVLPRRIGRRNADPANSAFTDRVSILSVPATAQQASLARAMTSDDAPIEIGAIRGCPLGRAACGFAVGMQALIFDETGAWDVFTVRDVSGSFLGHVPASLSKAYAPTDATMVVAVSVQVFSASADARELRRYDGDSSDMPLADDLVVFGIRLVGDPSPPLSPRPPIGSANCLYTAAGEPVLPTLGPEPGPLVELRPPMLADGPFCGTPANPWDADLLRVRAVRVALGFEASASVARGADLEWFARPGQAVRSGQLVPDYRLEFQVAPRNLNLGR